MGEEEKKCKYEDEIECVCLEVDTRECHFVEFYWSENDCFYDGRVIPIH